MDGAGDPERAHALEQYKNKLLESREWEAKLKNLRLGIRDLQKEVGLKSFHRHQITGLTFNSTKPPKRISRHYSRWARSLAKS